MSGEFKPEPGAQHSGMPRFWQAVAGLAVGGAAGEITRRRQSRKTDPSEPSVLWNPSGPNADAKQREAGLRHLMQNCLSDTFRESDPAAWAATSDSKVALAGVPVDIVHKFYNKLSGEARSDDHPLDSMLGFVALWRKGEGGKQGEWSKSVPTELYRTVFENTNRELYTAAVPADAPTSRVVIGVAISDNPNSDVQAMTPFVTQVADVIDAKRFSDLLTSPYGLEITDVPYGSSAG